MDLQPRITDRRQQPASPGAVTTWPPGLRDPGPVRVLSMAPFRFAAAYDRLRLSTCQEHGAFPDRIHVASLGSATLLRYDDLPGYNTVYAPEERTADHLPLIEEFFTTSLRGWQLIAATRFRTGRLARECESRGWMPDEDHAWMFGTPETSIAAANPGDVVVSRARIEERDEFIHTYVKAFGDAATDEHLAMANLRPLFLHPNFGFLLARWRGRPAGVGVVYHVGSSALLCESRILPAYRGLGGHRALIDARIHFAQSMGCLRLYAWAEFGSLDHAHLLRAGMRTVRTTAVWRATTPRRR